MYLNEYIEIRVPASTTKLAVLVLPPTEVHYGRIVGSTTATEHSCGKTSENRLGIVEKSIAPSTVHVVIFASRRRRTTVANVRVDFPYARSIDATRLQSSREIILDIVIEYKSRTVIINLASTDRNRTNTFSTFLSIDEIVCLCTYMVFKSAVLILRNKTLTLAFGSMFLSMRRLDTMSMVIHFPDQTIVSTWPTRIVVLMQVMVSEEQKSTHHHNRDHNAKDNDFDEYVEYERPAQSYMISPKVIVRHVFTYRVRLEWILSMVRLAPISHGRSLIDIPPIRDFISPIENTIFFHSPIE